MFREEKRKQERYSFKRPPGGTLFLVREDGARLSVVEINDISNSGVSLRMDQALAAAMPVTVEYADAVVCVQVRGTVTWCSHVGELPTAENFVIGIELASPMLFMSMVQQS